MKSKRPKTASAHKRRLHGVVRRIALSVELAWNNISGIATDLNIAVCQGTYEQHVEAMKQQFEREDAIRKKYAPNGTSSPTPDHKTL